MLKNIFLVSVGVTYCFSLV